MSVYRVSFGSSICMCGSVDFEQIQIERRLKAYGIEPTGNKTADKNKLHEIELQHAKMQNEPSGKFLTISYTQEQEIIKNKKENLNPNKKSKTKKDNKEILKEDEILGRQILAIIEMKKREEKDYKKSKELRVENKNKTTIINREQIFYSPQKSNHNGLESEEKSVHIKKEYKN